ncbi:MAG: DUF1275 family protein [Actinomycetes bacterium]
MGWPALATSHSVRPWWQSLPSHSARSLAAGGPLTGHHLGVIAGRRRRGDAGSLVVSAGPRCRACRNARYCGAGHLGWLLAVAMGGQNPVARRLSVPDKTTTALTLTLTGLVADASSWSVRTAGWRRSW